MAAGISIEAGVSIAALCLALLVLKRINAPQWKIYVLLALAGFWVAFIASASLGAAQKAEIANLMDDILAADGIIERVEPHFMGIVTEMHGSSILLTVNEGEEVRNSSDLISVSLDAFVNGGIFSANVGDEVLVYYNGEIFEGHVPRIKASSAILTKEREEVQYAATIYAWIDEENYTAFSYDVPYLFAVFSGRPMLKKNDMHNSGNVFHDPREIKNALEELLYDSFYLTLYFREIEDSYYISTDELREIAEKIIEPFPAVRYEIVVPSVSEAAEAAFGSPHSTDWPGNLKGKAMTLEEAQHFVEDKSNLAISDLAEYKGFNFSSNTNACIMLYSVDGGYTLDVRAGSDGKLTSADLRKRTVSYQAEQAAQVSTDQSSIDNEYAARLANMFVDSLNLGVDLTGDAGAIRSWCELAANGNPQFYLNEDSIEAYQNSPERYVFEINSLQADIVYSASIYVSLVDGSPSFYCPFTRYYPDVPPCFISYVEGLKSGNAYKLAKALSSESGSAAIKKLIPEAERHIEHYSRYNLETVKISGRIKYDDSRKQFFCAFSDANDERFEIKLGIVNGQIGILPPIE
ncbi:MAG: hypothetical protein LBU32_06460 [Clostridiales bacterium]|jgi:hypothetical protein|nr:hypothetical protein [Clostridiales bacterium]